MTYINSGNVNTGSNTPTGAVKDIAVDNPYITKDDFVQTLEAAGIGVTEQSDIYNNGQLDRAIMRASAWVNRHCRRYFDSQTIDETKTGFRVRPYNPELVTIYLNNSPYSKINSIYIQVLKWFIQIDTSSTTSYLQDFYEQGFCKIVPLLSNSGQGAGSPIPAEILDRVNLGVLWVNYTFGYGTPLTSQTLENKDSAANKIYQAPLRNRLWAPDQTITIYDNGVAVSASNYTLDYANGLVTFTSAITSGHTITADFTTNQSIPADIEQATVLMTMYYLGQAKGNPLGAQSYSMQTYSVSFGDNNKRMKDAEDLLEPYVRKTPILI